MIKNKDFKKIPTNQGFREFRENEKTSLKCPECKWFFPKKLKSCPLCSMNNNNLK